MYFKFARSFLLITVVCICVSLLDLVTARTLHNTDLSFTNAMTMKCPNDRMPQHQLSDQRISFLSPVVGSAGIPMLEPGFGGSKYNTAMIPKNINSMHVVDEDRYNVVPVSVMDKLPSNIVAMGSEEDLSSIDAADDIQSIFDAYKVPTNASQRPSISVSTAIICSMLVLMFSFLV